MLNQRLLKKYPRICAHLICESLGYLTPTSAEDLLKSHINNQEYYCEWTYDISMKAQRPLKQITHDLVRYAFQCRRYHHSYMADYKTARKLIENELNGNGPIFASWF